MKYLLAVLCCLLLSPAWAQSVEPVDNTAAYAQIDAARARDNAAFDAKEAACYQRFAVNRCLKAVQTQRTAAMNALRKQETALHDAERRQLGVDQHQRLEQKAQDKLEKDAQAQEDAKALAVEDRLQAQKDKRAEHAAKAASAASAPAATRETSSPSPQEQAQNRDAYAAKLAEAEKRRQAIAKQRTDRTGKSLPPVPATN